MKSTRSVFVVFALSLVAFTNVVSAQTTGGVVACSIEAVTLSSGQVQLTWGSTNAMFASIDNGVGNVAADGQMSVNKTATSTYNLHVWNAQGVNGYCSTKAVGSVLGATTTNPVVTVVTNKVTNNPLIISLGSVPYTGAEDYVYALFLVAFALTAAYGVSKNKELFIRA